MPGPLGARTGGSIYDRRMADALRAPGRQVHVAELDASFPHPTPAALDDASRALSSVSAGSIAVIDSLALGAMPDLVTREAVRLRIVALMHLPLAATVGLDAETVRRFEASERRALHAVERVIVTGKAAIPLLSCYGLPSDRIVIVEPGTDPAPLARGSGGSQLLCVATLNATKGHETLVEALAAVSHRDWHLTCAGSLTRDPSTADRVRATIDRLGLHDRVTLAGEVEEATLAGCYEQADVFVLATRQETYGMAVAEALARGLPVIATMTGALPELVGSDAGLLVPVGDTAALTAALARVLDDAPLRGRLAEGARRVRDRLPSWDEAANRMAAALASLDAHG